MLCVKICVTSYLQSCLYAKNMELICAYIRMTLHSRYTPSLGELLSQGKANVDAWWISLSTFAVLVVTLLLLTFMGDALRDALDPRKADVGPKADDALAPAPSDGSLMVSTR